MRFPIAMIMGALLLSMFGGCRRSDRIGDMAQENGYVGDCAPCHLDAAQAWHGSLHRRSMQMPSPESVKGDFHTDNVYTYQGMTTRMFVRDGVYYMETGEPGEAPRAYRVDYAIGDRDTQWYLTTLSDGRIQVLPVYYDIRERSWYDPTEGLIDHPDRLRPEDIHYWTNFGRNWNFQCYDCHASQIQKNYDPETGHYDTRWGDLSINCESCHGPGAAHVSFWRTLSDRASAPGAAMPNLKALTPDQSVEVCAQCHARKRIIATGYRPGDAFADFYELELLDNEKFWPDGRYRALNYNVLAFLMSPCHTQGGLSCTGCHDSHHLGPIQRGAWTSADAHDRICLDCHRVDIGDIRTHSRHEGVACVDCHMPVMAEVRRIRVRDHRISVPVPENEVRLGIPNACTGCHAGQPPEWAAEWVNRWWGSQADRVAKAEAIALGREGDGRAAEALIGLLADVSESVIMRASAAALLGRVGGRPAEEALILALEDGEPLVRAQVARGLADIGGPDAVPGLVARLEDARRLVRMRAALALSWIGVEGLADAAREALERNLSEYRDMVDALLADDPDAQVERGIALLHDGEDAAAEAAFRRALQLWHGMAEAYAGLGTIYARSGRYRESVQMWQRAVARDSSLVEPLHRVCELWEESLREQLAHEGHSADIFCDLGDSFAMRGQYGEAVAWYRQALALHADHAVARRNLALVYAQTGQVQEARAALQWLRESGADAEGIAQVERILKESELQDF